jgi:hypothetical protein
VSVDDLGEMPDRMTRLVIRQGLLCVAVPTWFAFIVSSPGQVGFWVALVGVFLVMVPAFAVVSWFRSDVRRIERSRATSSRGE